MYLFLLTIKLYPKKYSVNNFNHIILKNIYSNITDLILYLNRYILIA